MSDLVKITVAPGCHITLAPHPSGIQGMPPAVLYGGNTAMVTRTRAADLYAARLILDPVTGAMPPAYEAASQGITVQVPGSAPMSLETGINPQPRWDMTLDAVDSPRIVATAASGSNMSAGIRFHDLFTGPAIAGADGQPWPSF